MVARLIEGIHKFRTEAFGKYEGLFRRLAEEGQDPHTLFITCSDSRVLAELITQSKPGDLFVVKNAGNIVPPSSVTGSTNSTAAAVEFAVNALKVKEIVVCGHSQCGAMHALMDGIDKMDDSMPHLKSWLRLAEPVREIVCKRYTHLESDMDRCNAAAEENVLFALENLQTYPKVRELLDSGALRMHAWYFKIATAELYAYNPEQQQFLPLEPPAHD